MISLLKTLKENHIEPMVILYHWDIPLPLEETGDGLILNINTALAFEKYVAFCFVEYKDEVSLWVKKSDYFFNKILSII